MRFFIKKLFSRNKSKDDDPKHRLIKPYKRKQILHKDAFITKEGALSLRQDSVINRSSIVNSNNMGNRFDNHKLPVSQKTQIYEKFNNSFNKNSPLTQDTHIYYTERRQHHENSTCNTRCEKGKILFNPVINGSSNTYPLKYKKSENKKMENNSSVKISNTGVGINEKDVHNLNSTIKSEVDYGDKIEKDNGHNSVIDTFAASINSAKKNIYIDKNGIFSNSYRYRTYPEILTFSKEIEENSPNETNVITDSYININKDDSQTSFIVGYFNNKIDNPLIENDNHKKLPTTKSSIDNGQLVGSFKKFPKNFSLTLEHNLNSHVYKQREKRYIDKNSMSINTSQVDNLANFGHEGLVLSSISDSRFFPSLPNNQNSTTESGSATSITPPKFYFSNKSTDIHCNVKYKSTSSAISANSAPVTTTSYLRSRTKYSDKDLQYSTSSNVVGDAEYQSVVTAAKETLRRRRKEKIAELAKRRAGSNDDIRFENERLINTSHSYFFGGRTAALGTRGIAADLESLSCISGKSNNSAGDRSRISHHSYRSHKSVLSRRHNNSDGAGSISSKHSRTSRYSIKSKRSQLSQMSEQSRSVANDLLKLEMQLAMGGICNKKKFSSSSLNVNKDTLNKELESTPDSCSDRGLSLEANVEAPNAKSGNSFNEPYVKLSTKNCPSFSEKLIRMTVIVPPGKLGIILANMTGACGTVISGVRMSSVLSHRVNPGDRIIAIDGEDVSMMTVSEITTIMVQKTEFERVLTVLTPLRNP